MNTSVLKNSFNTLLTACALSLVGCTTDLYNPEPTPTPNPEPKPDSSIFDFSTEKSYTLNVKYDVPVGYNVDFEVYTENPIEVSEFGQVTKKDIKPFETGITDENGNYSYPINNVPTTAKMLYVYTSKIGVPSLMTAMVNGDQLEDAKVADLMQETKTMVLRSASDYEKTAYNQLKDFTVNPHKLGYWMNADGAYGRPGYLIDKKLAVDASILSWINSVVPNGKNNLNDHHLDPYLANGDINVGKDSEVWLYFLDEGTGAFSSMGYYCYETANPPTKASDIEKRVALVFPNAKKIGNGYGYGALNKGEGVQLHYIDANGKDQGTKIPAGTSIGWVIYNNSYRNAAKNGSVLTAKGNGPTVQSTIYSSPNLRPDKSIPQTALFRKDQFVALTMEDWYSGSDWDYNDVIFSVTSNPIQAILPDVPEAPDPEKPVTPTAAEYEGILAFEDLWPRQGDFDMNDVVVHYATKITYTTNNVVEKIEDTFTLLWSGATIHDGFAYMLNVPYTNVKIVSPDATIRTERDENTGNTIVRVFDDALSLTANNTAVKKVSFITTFVKPVDKKNIVLAPYNPFITTSSIDKEVHLTNKVPTSNALPKYFGTADDESIYGQGIYYVTHQRDENGNFSKQQMPFAIHMLGLGSNGFIIPAEGKRIDAYYPKFLNWVNTKGMSDADWFKHPAVPQK